MHRRQSKAFKHAEKRVVPLARKASASGFVGCVCANASSSVGVGAQCETPPLRATHSKPLAQHPEHTAHGAAHVSSSPAASAFVVGEQRPTQLWTHAWYAAAGVDGHRSMQPLSEPAGQPAGTGGDGLGDGPGDGDGGAPPAVEPSSPYRMFEYLTYASACWDSTSAGLPESVEHVPRLAPGAVGVSVG